MAIYRAGQMPRNAKVLVLVYNRPLCDYIKTGITAEAYSDVEVQTLHSWTSGFFARIARPVPTIGPGVGECNWAEIGKILESLHHVFYSHIIIDESQDCPETLLRGLSKIATNITCFIDPNQAVTGNGLAGLIQTMGILCQPAPVTLTKNFRNTQQIRDASALFWTHEPGTTPPAEAVFRGNRPRMVKCAKNGGQYDYNDQTTKMVRIIMNNLDKEIGVVVNPKSLNRTMRELKDSLGDAIAVQMHKPKTHFKIDFKKQGVKILSHGTMKGLEFDMLLFPGLDFQNNSVLEAALNSPAPNAVEEARKICRNRLYVAFSRPLTELVIFHFNDYAGLPKRQKPILKPIFDHPELFDWEDDVPSDDIPTLPLFS